MIKHLIVDGWNIIHASPKLSRLLAASAESARAELLTILSAIHDWQGSRVTIVYDGKGDEFSIERPNFEVKTFSEVFTPSVLTADELIEQLCANSKNASEIAVATRDNMLRLTSSSFGAVTLLPDELFEMASSSYLGVSRSTYANSRKVDSAWKSGRKKDIFGALDLLSTELSDAMNSVPSLISKKLKKRLKRDILLSDNIASNVDKVKISQHNNLHESSSSNVKTIKKMPHDITDKTSVKSFGEIRVRGTRIEIRQTPEKSFRKKKRNK